MHVTRDRLLFAAGVAFLLLQGVLVVRARFVAAKDFCWAPHTTQVRYTIRTTAGGRALTDHEIALRYRVPATGWEAHSYRNLLDLVAQYERTYGARDRASVVVTYSINGRASRQWHWPRGETH